MTPGAAMETDLIGELALAEDLQKTEIGETIAGLADGYPIYINVGRLLFHCR